MYSIVWPFRPCHVLMPLMSSSMPSGRRTRYITNETGPRPVRDALFLLGRAMHDDVMYIACPHNLRRAAFYTLTCRIRHGTLQERLLRCLGGDAVRSLPFAREVARISRSRYGGARVVGGRNGDRQKKEPRCRCWRRTQLAGSVRSGSATPGRVSSPCCSASPRGGPRDRYFRHYPYERALVRP